MALSDYLTVQPLVFGAVDRLKTKQSETVMIVARKSALDAGTLSFLAEAAECTAVSTVYVAVRDESRFRDVQGRIASRLEALSIKLYAVEIDSTEFVSALAESSVLLLTSQFQIPNYRLCNRHQRDVVRIHHGILTKSYGTLTAKNLKKQQQWRRKKLGYPNKQKYITNIGIDVQSVESDTERFYRSTAECRSPTIFRKYGYPRFDRIRRLLDNTREPLIPESTATQLSASNAFRVLYAPTHKDDAYSTTLFPFPDFDLEIFRQYLRKHGIELYVRMHFSEDESVFYQRVVDGDTIIRAGQEFSPSPTEILPSFDAVVTDYSSIYIDYLPVDNPIIFLKDDHESFLNNRGIAFDYDDYFPGRKIETFEEFRRHLTRCVETGTDGYEADREFVRRTFLPERDQTFLEQIIENHLNTA